ncbi:MAG TPA: histidine kinase, partial [Acidobacteriota bacterium]|nr:histidine kinase [Acidobacteriota bacterium]
MSTETLNNILFPILAQTDIDCLIPYGSVITLEPGDVFFHEGEPFGYFAIVLDGEIKISKQAAG